VKRDPRMASVRRRSLTATVLTSSNLLARHLVVHSLAFDNQRDSPSSAAQLPNIRSTLPMTTAVARSCDAVVKLSR